MSSLELTRDDLDQLMTVDDVATLLQVNRSWVYEHTRRRGARACERLPYVKIGKYVRFDARLVREFISRRTQSR